MKVNGIIAEYNPFHNGHLYQLETSRKRTGADYTVVVMSGNFTQRGEAAILSKYVRTEMALRCGADLVLELPALFAAGSAEFFATGAAALLDRLGVVDYLCFGSECGNAKKLTELAKILAEEPEDFKRLLQGKLAQGMNFPAARASALQEAFPSAEDIDVILKAPNNILGLEYAKALLCRGSAIKLCTITRMGSGYHSDKIEGTYPSALSIRKALLCPSQSCAKIPSGKETNNRYQAIPGSDPQVPEALHSPIPEALHSPGPIPEALQGQMPEAALLLLGIALKSDTPIQNNDFSGLLHYKLLSEEAYGFEKYLDVSHDLSGRIQNLIYQYRDFDSFCNALKTKDMTYTRISRCLLHILLNITKEDLARSQALGWVPYARILGLRKSASPLLGAIKSNASVPLISKLADAGHILEGEPLQMLADDIRISHIYNSVIALKSGRPMRNEYATPIVVLP